MPTGTGPLVLKTREPFTIRYKGTLFFPFSSYTGQSSPRKPNHPRFTLFRLTREPQVGFAQRCQIMREPLGRGQFCPTVRVAATLRVIAQ